MLSRPQNSWPFEQRGSVHLHFISAHCIAQSKYKFKTLFSVHRKFMQLYLTGEQMQQVAAERRGSSNAAVQPITKLHNGAKIYLH